jgi:hypothetical protein
VRRQLDGQRLQGADNDRRHLPCEGDETDHDDRSRASSPAPRWTPQLLLASRVIVRSAAGMNNNALVRPAETNVSRLRPLRARATDAATRETRGAGPRVNGRCRGASREEPPKQTSWGTEPTFADGKFNRVRTTCWQAQGGQFRPSADAPAWCAPRACNISDLDRAAPRPWLYQMPGCRHCPER